MSGAKYTKGPWEKSDRLNGPWWHISSQHTVGGRATLSGKQSIACVHGASKRGSLDYAEMFEANARLIAAAPALLEALQFVMSATGEQLTTAFEQAQDAIELALGEEDAWECSSCGGQGRYTRYHKVTHQLGSDELPFWEQCETCGGLGSCGPDAERRAARKRARK